MERETKPTIEQGVSRRDFLRRTGLVAGLPSVWALMALGAASATAQDTTSDTG